MELAKMYPFKRFAMIKQTRSVLQKICYNYYKRGNGLMFSQKRTIRFIHGFRENTSVKKRVTFNWYQFRTSTGAVHKATGSFASRERY